MSLPRELLDELLSRYMDGELSADEATRVEQMLQSDASVRASLELLRTRSSLVRQAVRDGGKLGEDFSSRVFAAAVSEAESTNLRPDHPLRLAASGRTSGNRGRGWQVAGLVALAASLLLVAFFASRDFGTAELADGDSLQTPQAEKSEIAGTELAGVDTALLVEQANDTEDATPTETATADADASAAKSMLAENNPAGNNVQGSQNSAISAANLTIDSPSADSIVSLDSAPDAGKLPAGMAKLRAVMVYEISVTAKGRENNVVGRAFRDAGIRLADERKVDEALVGYLRDSGLVAGQATELVNEEDEQTKRCQLLFLEGSGLKLERAMLELLAAEEDVSKVGFNMMMNPPVFAAIDQLKDIDPTLIRNPDNDLAVDSSMAIAQSLSPAGVSGAANFMETEGSFVVGNQMFAPLGRNSMKNLSQFSGIGNEGANDITAQVLMIIRFE